MIVLFAGTFDPFHRGHRAILESALTAYPEARALVTPARGPRWRAAPALSYERRCEIARRSIAGLRARLFEAPDAVDRTALDLVRELRRSEPDAELLYLVGADAAASIPAWDGLAELIAEATLLVAPRVGTRFSLEELLDREPSLHGRVRLLAPSGVEASASAVRAGARELLVDGVGETAGLPED
jgi:nicotinate-nucleotide adenylyltransferase